MLRLCTKILLCAGALAVGIPAQAAIIRLEASLTHDQEVGTGATPLVTSTGAPRPLSFGTAVFFLDDVANTMTMSVVINNIDITGTQTPDTFDNLVAAHIHVGAGFGTNAPVRWGFFGTPDNDNNPDQLVVTPFAIGVGGTFTSVWDAPEGNAGTTFADNETAILAELSYINFHTVQFGGGEIRGQLLRVPEPATLALIGLGLLGLAGWRKRKSA